MLTSKLNSQQVARAVSWNCWPKLSASQSKKSWNPLKLESARSTVQHEGGMRTASNGRGWLTCSHDSSSAHREQLIGYFLLAVTYTTNSKLVSSPLRLRPSLAIAWHHRHCILFGRKQSSNPIRSDEFYESLVSFFNVAWLSHMPPSWKLFTSLLTPSLFNVGWMDKDKSTLFQSPSSSFLDTLLDLC